MRSSSASELTALLGQVLMESCWVYALVRVILALAPSALPLGWGRLLALQLMAALLARLAGAAPGPAALRRAGLAAAELILLGVFLHATLSPGVAPIRVAWLLKPAISGPHALLTWLAFGFVSARGTLIGAGSAEPEAVRRWYMIGSVVLVLLYALLARGGVPASALPAAELQLLTCGYFLGGACVCALVERQAAFARAQLTADHGLAFALALGVPVCALALGSLILAAGALGVRALVARLSEVGWWMARVAWLGAQGLAQGVAWLLRLIAVSMGDAPRESARNGSGLSDLPFGLGARHDPLARTDWDALPLVLGLGLLLSAALFLRFWLAARVRERTAEVAEDSASVLSFEALLERWRGRFGAARALLSRGRGELRSLFQPSRQPQDVRALYRQLLGWAAAHGHPRRSGVTAWELAHELGRAFPDRRSELQALTAYYQAVRYGAHAASETELAHARELLAAVLREPAPAAE